MKNNRKIKVYETKVSRKYKAIPQIRLQGEWLRLYGFEIGSEVNIECENNKLIITLDYKE